MISLVLDVYDYHFCIKYFLKSQQSNPHELYRQWLNHKITIKRNHSSGQKLFPISPAKIPNNQKLRDQLYIPQKPSFVSVRLRSFALFSIRENNGSSPFSVVAWNWNYQHQISCECAYYFTFCYHIFLFPFLLKTSEQKPNRNIFIG